MIFSARDNLENRVMTKITLKEFIEGIKLSNIAEKSRTVPIKDDSEVGF